MKLELPNPAAATTSYTEAKANGELETLRALRLRVRSRISRKFMDRGNPYDVANSFINTFPIPLEWRTDAACVLNGDLAALEKQKLFLNYTDNLQQITNLCCMAIAVNDHAMLKLLYGVLTDTIKRLDQYKAHVRTSCVHTDQLIAYAILKRNPDVLTYLLGQSSRTTDDAIFHTMSLRPEHYRSLACMDRLYAHLSQTDLLAFREMSGRASAIGPARILELRQNGLPDGALKNRLAEQHAEHLEELALWEKAGGALPDYTLLGERLPIIPLGDDYVHLMSFFTVEYGLEHQDNITASAYLMLLLFGSARNFLLFQDKWLNVKNPLLTHNLADDVFQPARMATKNFVGQKPDALYWRRWGVALQALGPSCLPPDLGDMLKEDVLLALEKNMYNTPRRGAPAP